MVIGQASLRLRCLAELESDSESASRKNPMRLSSVTKQIHQMHACWAGKHFGQCHMTSCTISTKQMDRRTTGPQLQDRPGVTTVTTQSNALRLAALQWQQPILVRVTLAPERSFRWKHKHGLKGLGAKLAGALAQ